MKEWNERALVTLAVTIIVCILIVLLFHGLRQALARSQDMEEQLEMMAVTDALTGIPNRRAFDMAMSNEIRRAIRHKVEVSVLMIDVDHFKAINDSHGHAVGDEVLRRIARQISESVRRPGDFAARHGGEEFAVLLPCTGAIAAMQVAQKIRTNIMHLTPSPSTPALHQVCVSIGVASMRPTPGDTAAEILRQADEALYAAKATGRNRVVIRPDAALAQA